MLSKAEYYGNIIGWPETIQAILLTESSAGDGGRIGDDGNSLGVMQMKPATAVHVINEFPWLPKMTEKEVAAELLRSDDYAIFLGTLYFKLCLTKHKTWKRAVVCYNTGLYGKYYDNHKYLRKVTKSLSIVRGLK